jgi:hypothetical protein
MVREIKFRAWDQRKKEYHKGIIAVSNDGVMRMLDTTEHEMWADTSFVAEQYTGLNDKNGVEIYEGDVIINTDFPRQPATVIFQHCCFRVDVGSFLTLDHYHPSLLEVIGNIHENKELLEGK